MDDERYNPYIGFAAQRAALAVKELAALKDEHKLLLARLRDAEKAAKVLDELNDNQAQTIVGLKEQARTLSKDWEAHCDAARDLRQENEKLRQELIFWAGEKREDRPEIIEWRKLASITPADRSPKESARLSAIAKQLRIEAETEPELRKRIGELEATLSLRNVIDQKQVDAFLSAQGKIKEAADEQ